ncbi:thioredoxin domain-containing protein [Candidatus Saccharibacteria bacterium]|nr:thioredoxin domain-containing protein [Candidatus Saccharibacteria bacterium]
MKTGKIIRIIGIVVIVVAIFAAMVASMSQKPSNAERVWDKEMTVGNMEAKNYFIIYSDVACPYCVAFENAIIEHEEDFKRYIEQNDVLVEIRVSDFLYEYGQSKSIESRYGAEAIYCARNEGRFWDYYNLAITKVWNEYYAKLGKSAFGEFNKLGKDYWIDMGKEIGLGETFVSCVENDETVAEIKKNAEKSAKLVNGMPYFKFNDSVQSGFDLSWGWEYVLMYFNSGLKS